VTYPALALIGVVVTVVLDLWVVRTRLLTTANYWIAYAVVVFFQLVVNGVLTCNDIVTGYRTILGPRVACAPVEDLLFGFAMVTQTLVWWVALGRRAAARPRSRT
jgi:lycopene cyclase domain-containing protein